jgi:hypothetical protein
MVCGRENGAANSKMFVASRWCRPTIASECQQTDDEEREPRLRGEKTVTHAESAEC